MTHRAAGILLHPTSLPSSFGVGDLGPSAERFLAWAARAGQSWWQVLPLVPPDSHGSPYSGLSAFALNPLLISPELLRDDGWLEPGDLETVPSNLAEEQTPGIFRIRLDAASAWKDELLRRAWLRFDNASAQQREDFERFCGAPEQSWLDDFALFAALRARHGNQGWWDWPSEVARRESATLEATRKELASEIGFHRFVQWLAWGQWGRLREIAREHRIRILGDLPIYVAYDSAEVWARRELFDLDTDGRPHGVAGVPPDDFSDDGQLWGNPLYRWDRMAEEGYAWWIDRLRANLRCCDRVRLDHFRGFESFWRVPSGEETAVHGEWIPGPGRAIFDALKSALGELPLVAEDLGVITDEVRALRRDTGLPGIRVLHFGLDDPSSEHAPHHHTRDSVIYTGTHDNDTTVGWYRSLDRATRHRVRRYSGADASARRIHRAMVRLAYSSVAELAIVPLQDVLGLDGEARMNRPALTGGNWSWRAAENHFEPSLADRLRELVELTDRLPKSDD